MLYDKDYMEYASKMIIIFYVKLNKTDFNILTLERIKELKELAPNLLDSKFISKHKFINYVKRLRNLNYESEKYGINNDAEKYVLFMFSIDPTFEAIKIYGECNHINQTKEKMKKFFGVYDSNLIKIENNFIKTFLSEKEKKEIDEEIEKRVFS